MAMERTICLIGFGEAGRTFAQAGAWRARAHAFDAKTDDEGARAEKLADYGDAGVSPCLTLADAVRPARLILSLVTADAALDVANAAARAIAPGALFLDMNSVAPQTKQAAAARIEAAGGAYVDVAIMAPVNPARLAVPLLLSGARAAEAGQALADFGFTNVRQVGDAVGRASAIKMIRSVMVKGLEALTAECALAAEAAGVRAEVLASLDASRSAGSWSERTAYNLERMMVHGLRRAAEMEEVVKTLEAFGTGSAMTRGTVERQRAIGLLGIDRPGATLDDRLEQINGKRARTA